jgi:hypothetical protein
VILELIPDELELSLPGLILITIAPDARRLEAMLRLLNGLVLML